nr:uncharacterized mitochondrial protein AtMg00810-like [Tanacetum cinerariifolium]
MLFQPLFDELLTPPSSVDHPAPEVISLIAEVVALEPAASTGLPSTTTVDQDAPSPSNSQTTPKTQSPIIPNDVEEDNHDLDITHMNNDPFFDALTQSYWIKAMQEVLNEFERLGVWELVPRPDKVMVITLKWIYKVKLDELGASRPDLQFAICTCSRYQARPTEKHLHAVKRIFRYLRGTVNQGLWYPKDSLITLREFADADHAGCQDTRCSISGSMQFLGDRLEHVENDMIELYFVNTEYQLADIFTKALGRESIEFLINKLGMRSFTPKTLKQLADEVEEIISITKEQQQALDDALVPREQCLRIGNSNYRLSTTFKPKEPTFQVALDKFFDPLFEEEILAFLSNLGYPGYIKTLSKVKFEILPQPWRTFKTIINKCLSGKVNGLDLLRLSRAQILWGMYHQKNVDYVYLLWEDLIYQIENKVSERKKDMYYPRFTKIIIDHFMSQDLSIPRRNKVDWHMASDDPILTTMRFIPQHEVVQNYGAILPDNLTNQSMKESEEYKTYYAFATGKAIPKPKYVCRSVKEKSKQAPKVSFGERIKSPTKVTRSGKKKQIAKGLETLSEIALSEDEHMKLAIKRSKTQLHSSQPGGLGAHKGTGVSPGVPDVPTYGSDDERISWKFSDEKDDDDETNTNSDNDGDDFVHPKFSTHDEEDKEEDSFDPRVQTPSHVETTDDEDNNEEIQGVNVEGDELDEEDEWDELYKDVNTNQFAEAVSLIPGIVDTFLANKMNEAIKTAVQLQSGKLKDEAQAENEDFINKLDENIKKIIKEQVKE